MSKLLQITLVFQLTHSGLAFGITNALQIGPVLAFGLYGGVHADRFNRRRLVLKLGRWRYCRSPLVPWLRGS